MSKINFKYEFSRLLLETLTRRAKMSTQQMTSLMEGIDTVTAQIL